jgi:chromosome segregation ATPase
MSQPTMVTERRVWTGLQKLVVTGLTFILTTGTGLAGWSVKMQIEAGKRAEVIREEAAQDRAIIRNEVRDLQEANRLIAARTQKLEDYGPNAGDRVTAEDLQALTVEIMATYRQQQAATEKMTAALLQVNTKLAEVSSELNAGRRERDRMMTDIDKLRDRP